MQILVSNRSSQAIRRYIGHTNLIGYFTEGEGIWCFAISTEYTSRELNKFTEVAKEKLGFEIRKSYFLTKEIKALGLDPAQYIPGTNSDEDFMNVSNGSTEKFLEIYFKCLEFGGCDLSKISFVQDITDPQEAYCFGPGFLY